MKIVKVVRGVGAILTVHLLGCVAVYNHSHLEAKRKDAVYQFGYGHLTASASPSGGGAVTSPPWKLVFTLAVDTKITSLVITKIEADVDGKIYRSKVLLKALVPNTGYVQVETDYFIPKPKNKSGVVIIEYEARIFGDKPRKISRKVKYFFTPSKGVTKVNPLLDYS